MYTDLTCDSMGVERESERKRVSMRVRVSVSKRVSKRGREDPHPSRDP